MTRSRAQSQLIEKVRRRFAAEFGPPQPRMFFAPGRVNLVGAHLDYNGGDVLPMSVDQGIYVAARLADSGQLRLRSLDQERSVDVGTDAVGERASPELGWAAYPIGVWRCFHERTGLGLGVEMVFGGDLPMASGLSSSAAIEIATAVALDALHDTGFGREELALMAHRAETSYVGVQCGIMDQFASALGRPGQVLLLHCSGPRYEYVPLDPNACEVLVMDTRKPRELGDTHFNERVRECSEAHRFLREQVRDRPHLASYTCRDLEAAGPGLSGVHRKRARHVVTEMERITGAVAAVRRGDIATLGQALTNSHRSCVDDYEVSCAELDVITETARQCAGVHGARLTGAGFGGCAIALLEPGRAQDVTRRVREVFVERFGVEPGFDLLHAGAGPGEIAQA